MNRFVQAISDLDVVSAKKLIHENKKWSNWSEPDGKNALHYLGGVVIGKNPEKAAISLQIAKLLLKNGLDINAIHKIPERGGFFPGTPLWYAYTRGRNEKLYRFLLKTGAIPDHCMFAIAWYDDVKAAALFKRYGASITDASGKHSPFLAAFTWKKFKIAEWFLKNGADANVADHHGNTALFYSVKRKYEPEHVRLLLKFGADFDRENNQGISPKKFAETKGPRRYLKFFIR